MHKLNLFLNLATFLSLSPLNTSKRFLSLFLNLFFSYYLSPPLYVLYIPTPSLFLFLKATVSRDPRGGGAPRGRKELKGTKISFKGSVQRKLWCVQNGVNRSVGAWDSGAGHSFVVLFRFRLGFAIFPFPVSTAEFIGEFWTNK
jgi:hypothetical protein